MSRAGGKHQVEGGSTKINLVNLNQGLKKNKPGIKEDLYTTLCNRGLLSSLEQLLTISK